MSAEWILVSLWVAFSSSEWNYFSLAYIFLWGRIVLNGAGMNFVCNGSFNHSECLTNYQYLSFLPAKFLSNHLLQWKAVLRAHPYFFLVFQIQNWTKFRTYFWYSVFLPPFPVVFTVFWKYGSQSTLWACWSLNFYLSESGLSSRWWH